MHVLGLQRAMPDASFGLATEVLRALRMAKDPDEIELLRLAAHAADRVIDQIAAGPLVGRTEIEVSREVRERLLAEGHDLAEFAIVAAGPDSASPHHDATDRVIEAGEPIVLDIGGSLGGYTSDTTRTLWVTGGDPAKGPTPEFRTLFEVLETAQAAAVAAVRPGVSCEAIDATARSLISDAGFGPAFLHRTGHGIGLEVHEEPYIVAGNEEPLQSGFAFSVEPGIYLAGRYGARIEDIVVCGPDGSGCAERLEPRAPRGCRLRLAVRVSSGHGQIARPTNDSSANDHLHATPMRRRLATVSRRLLRMSKRIHHAARRPARSGRPGESHPVESRTADASPAEPRRRRARPAEPRPADPATPSPAPPSPAAPQAASPGARDAAPPRPDSPRSTTPCRTT